MPAPPVEISLPDQIETSTDEEIELDDGLEFEDEDDLDDEIEAEDEDASEVSVEDKNFGAYQQIEASLPAFIRPVSRRLAQYGETERGKTAIGLGITGVFLACVACIVFGLVFQPYADQVQPTLAAIVGTKTPTPTLTLAPPTDTPTPTVTPTPTDAPTPTPTSANTQVVFDTPTVTSTSTRTPIPPPDIIIVSVNDIEEYVDILNAGRQPENLAGWKLLSERDRQECSLAGVIEPGQILRIWALLVDTAQGGYNCAFDQEVWHDTEPDAAVLYNPGGAEVARLD